MSYNSYALLYNKVELSTSLGVICLEHQNIVIPEIVWNYFLIFLSH